jgi:hypothetical protein
MKNTYQTEYRQDQYTISLPTEERLLASSLQDKLHMSSLRGLPLSIVLSSFIFNTGN